MPRGGLILGKSGDMFVPLALHFGTLPNRKLIGDDLAIVYSDCGEEFRLYARRDSDNRRDLFEMPEAARRNGFCYVYLVECRSERLLAEVMHSFPAGIEILFCDNDEQLFRPHELSADRVEL